MREQVDVPVDPDALHLRPNDRHERRCAEQPKVAMLERSIWAPTCAVRSQTLIEPRRPERAKHLRAIVVPLAHLRHCRASTIRSIVGRRQYSKHREGTWAN